MLKKLLVHKSNHPFVQFIRYGLVVAIAFPIDFGLLYLFTSKLHMYYVLSATLSFTISMIVNYLLSIVWVFTERTARAMWVEAGLFAIIGFVGLGLTDLIIWICTSTLGVHYLVSKLIAVTVVFFWSFGARRFMFRTQFAKLEQEAATAAAPASANPR